ncbi:MAG: tRNA (adenosine(37)-N6)-dimethylallyltransferase MiaA [Mycoplasmataceae bacterium]|nr:tRNA (adenosine(37)-N6)-dimethylallyltransferase MiaA [Mycoplasmataceae bacterium]
MQKLIVIVGPTGSGKTKIAIEITKKINGALINADAYQVYKEIEIGTAKATKDEYQDIEVYNNGDVSINEEWDIKIFQGKAKKIIDTIINKGKIPIIVGGSNLYVEALIFNYDLSAKPRTSLYEELTNEQLYEQIKNINPDIASKIQIQNKRRLVRALQILKNNDPFQQKNEQIYKSLLITPHIELPKLLEKVANNVDKMLNKGWKKEVEDLYKKDKNISSLNAFKAIGYQEILDSIINNTEINIEQIKHKTRKYARRQITWIKNKFKNVLVYNNNFEQIIEKINEFLRNN